MSTDWLVTLEAGNTVIVYTKRIDTIRHIIQKVYDVDKHRILLMNGTKYHRKTGKTLSNVSWYHAYLIEPTDALIAEIQETVKQSGKQYKNDKK